jgi:hypothetical protein
MKKTELAINKIVAITAIDNVIYITCNDKKVYWTESITFCNSESTICFIPKKIV